jgi:hypothetical protein
VGVGPKGLIESNTSSGEGGVFYFIFIFIERHTDKVKGTTIVTVVSYSNMLLIKHTDTVTVITARADSRNHATVAFHTQEQELHFWNPSVSCFPGILVPFAVLSSFVLITLEERVLLEEISYCLEIQAQSSQFSP